MSYAVTRRTREIGIRIVIGARPSSVPWLVPRDACVLGLAGAAIEVPISITSMKWIATFLYGLKSGDPLTLVSVVFVLTAVVFVAGYVPARSAASIEPSRALRAH